MLAGSHQSSTQEHLNGECERRPTIRIPSRKNPLNVISQERKQRVKDRYQEYRHQCSKNREGDI